MPEGLEERGDEAVHALEGGQAEEDVALERLEAATRIGAAIVQQHLPQFQPDDPRAGQITVRDLLDHTSGLTDAMVPDLSRIQPHTTQDAVTSLRAAHLGSR